MGIFVFLGSLVAGYAVGTKFPAIGCGCLIIVVLILGAIASLF